MFTSTAGLRAGLHSMVERARKAVFHPTVRLNPDFPLAGKQLGRAYIVGNIYFAVGSLAPIALMFIGLFVLMGALKLCMHLPIHTAVPLLRLLRFPVFWVQHLMAAQSTFMVAIVTVCFFTGFGAQLWYLNRLLARQGQSLRQVISFDLRSIAGSWWGATLWALTWRTAVVTILFDCVDILFRHFVPAPQQATMDLSKKLAGSNLFVYFLVAAIIGPIVEEVLFRGFMFRGLLATFRQGRLGKWMIDHHLSNVAAVVVSAIMFTAAHALTGSNLVAFFMIFLVGCYLAEVYRRTGTLWPGILFHALNNGYAVLMLALRHH